MRIGDIEYTREVVVIDPGLTTAKVDVAFALGIKVRPLLVRTSVQWDFSLAATGNQGVWMENGQSVPVGLSFAGALQEERLHALQNARVVLVTSGMYVLQQPWELMWWKILLPGISLHAKGAAAGDDCKITLHYRFAELTDDEVIEIAAQRAQD